MSVFGFRGFHLCKIGNIFISTRKHFKTDSLLVHSTFIAFM